MKASRSPSRSVGAVLPPSAGEAQESRLAGRLLRSRSPRRSLIVVTGSGSLCEGHVAALSASLGALGIDATYVGNQQDASRIAAMALEQEADTIEICLTGSGGVALLRQLLRELIQTGRREVRIVVHRIA